MLNVFLSLVQLFFITSQIQCQNVSKLLGVAVIYRHGDRTPIDLYPKDPYRNSSYWPVGFGQLTNEGKLEEFQLGQWLKQRYSGLLPDSYSENDIRVRSTDVDRTLMSAELVLAGLYPPSGKQTWNEKLKWQPIPIHTTPELEDNLLAMKKRCDKYTYLLDELLKSPEFVAMRKRNHDLYAYLSRSTGEKVTTLEDLELIYSTLVIEELYNFTLPNWTRNVFPDKLKPLADFAFAVACYTPSLARLKTGVLLNEISTFFLNITKQTQAFKVLMYSGHDITVANVLNALNVFDYHSPPYGATVLFELRILNGNSVVNVLYKNGSVPRNMVLKGCEFDCPFVKFMEILEPIRLNNEQWNAECQMKLLGIIPFTTLQNTVFISCTLLLVLIITSFAVSCVCVRKRQYKHSYLKLSNQEV